MPETRVMAASFALADDYQARLLPFARDKIAGP